MPSHAQPKTTSSPAQPAEEAIEPSGNRRSFLEYLTVGATAFVMGRLSTSTNSSSRPAINADPSPLSNEIPKAISQSPEHQAKQHSPHATDISQNGIMLIKEFESLRLDAYLCSSKRPTIGYGHTKGVKLGDRLNSIEEAEQLLREDLKLYCQQVLRVFEGVPLTQPQFDALTSAHYNSGCLTQMVKESGKSAIKLSGFAEFARTQIPILQACDDPREKSNTLQSIVCYLSRYNLSGKNFMDGLLRRRLSEGLLMAGEANPVVAMTEYTALKHKCREILKDQNPPRNELVPAMVELLFERRGLS